MYDIMSVCTLVNLLTTVGFILHRNWGRFVTGSSDSDEYHLFLLMSMLNIVGSNYLRDLRKLTDRYLADEGYETSGDKWNEIARGVAEVRTRWSPKPVFQPYSAEKEFLAYLYSR